MAHPGLRIPLKSIHANKNKKMKPIEKADKLSTHFAKVSDKQIGDAIAAAHKAVKHILNLPENVKVSGLRFDLDDDPNPPCTPHCWVDSQGRTHCEC